MKTLRTSIGIQNYNNLLQLKKIPSELEVNLQARENQQVEWKGNETLTDSKFDSFAHEYEICIERALSNGSASGIDELLKCAEF